VRRADHRQSLEEDAFMNWIRIGGRILNPSSIVEVIDEGEQAMKSGMQRVVRIKLIAGDPVVAVGAEADALWAAATRNADVWSDTYSPPDYKMGFH
jgi:hypothetical protein